MKRLLAVLVALAFALAGCSSSGSSSKPRDLTGSGGGTFQGAGLDQAQPRPQFTLTDLAGKPFALGTATAKHPTLLYFGYTQCPDVCPQTMASAQQALERVPAAVAKQTYVVFVTTDVAHDTRAVLTKWLSAFSAKSPAHWVGLTGTQAQIDAAQAAAHVSVAEDGGRTHSAQLLLYGPDDYAHVTFLESSTQQQQIQHDLPLVAAGRT